MPAEEPPLLAAMTVTAAAAGSATLSCSSFAAVFAIKIDVRNSSHRLDPHLDRWSISSPRSIDAAFTRAGAGAIQTIAGIRLGLHSCPPTAIQIRIIQAWRS